MKILAFSDIHDEITYLDIINKKTKKYDPDILICAGDISFFARNLNSSMTVLKKLNKPTLIIPGNHETAPDIFSFKSENLIPLHKQIYIKDDYCFYGYGGGGFSQTANDLFNNFKKFENKFENKKLIIVTHFPPYKTDLDIINKIHVGNKTLRDIILKYSPKIVISGHLHENERKSSYINKTLCINPGPKGIFLKI